MCRREICNNIGHGDFKKACTLWHTGFPLYSCFLLMLYRTAQRLFSMKISLTTLHFLIPEIIMFYLWKKKKRKEKNERETKKELIGSLGYIKCIPSLLVELSSCYLAFGGMGQDKILPPHQVRISLYASPGLPTCLLLNLEQSSTCPRMSLQPSG